jgi:hypothetical protein
MKLTVTWEIDVLNIGISFLFLVLVIDPPPGFVDN